MYACMSEGKPDVYVYMCVWVRGRVISVCVYMTCNMTCDVRCVYDV